MSGVKHVINGCFSLRTNLGALLWWKNITEVITWVIDNNFAIVNKKTNVGILADSSY